MLDLVVFWRSGPTGLVNLQFVRFYAKPNPLIRFDFSGDLASLKPLDEKELFFPFKELGGLENEPEEIKRIFSLEFCTSKDKMYHREHETLKKIDQFCGPHAELERKIVKSTIHIRNMVPYCLQCTSDKKAKSELVIRIAKRKKYFKLLRREDYDRFIWLLKELKIRYIPARHTTRVTKKEKRVNAEKGKADQIKLEKEVKLQELLQKEKEEYLKIKQQMLEEIEREIEEYDLDRDEILNNVEDIRYGREQPPKKERTGFASLKVWEKPKVPPRYYELK